MFGLEPSLSAKKALKSFKKKKVDKIIEIGAGLGRDTVFFAKNLIHTTALDYSASGIKVINQKAKQDNLSNYISTKLFDIRKKLPFEDNSIQACYSHMLYCMALTTIDLEKLNNEILRILKPGGLIFIPYAILMMVIFKKVFIEEKIFMKMMDLLFIIFQKKKLILY